MDGQSGGDDNRGGASWRGGRTYDATNQIKQLLGVPTEDLGKPIVEAERRTPPQNIPRNRQVGLGSAKSVASVCSILMHLNVLSSA